MLENLRRSRHVGEPVSCNAMRAAAPLAPSAQVAPGNIKPVDHAPRRGRAGIFMECSAPTIANVSLRYLPVASPPQRPTASDHH